MKDIINKTKFSTEENRKFWNNYAENAKNKTIGAHSDKHIIELENNFIENILKSKKSKNLLEIGCGNGQRTIRFSKYCAGKTLGVDYSSKMMSQANLLLQKQDKNIQKKVSFEVHDINHFTSTILFDIVISCRCIVNQASTSDQLRLFEKIHEHLQPGGSFIIAEQSEEGLEYLDSLRKEFGLNQIKVPWHNLPIKESYILSKLKNKFEIKKLNRLGNFYYISRVIHPVLIFPEEPDPNAKINDLALKAELIFQERNESTKNHLEKYGSHLLIHLVKK